MPSFRPSRAKTRTRLSVLAAAVALAGLAAGCGGSSHPSDAHLLAGNPNVDNGTSEGARPAPNFTLTDERGRKVSLSSYRGKAVVLAFTDSQCTTVCPLTTQAMVDAKRSLGPAARDVQLLGVDANPQATQIHDVLSYTELHGLLGKWHFLTGSDRQLRSVWKHYGIAVDIERGQIDHTAALFVIDPQGRLRKVYLTTQSYAAVSQLGQVVAHEVAGVLPSHPRVATTVSYATIHGLRPTQPVSMPRQGGGTVRLGPGHGAHLLVFFATWDRQVMNLSRDLDQLNGYAAAARSGGLPALTAVDEASIEPSTGALGKLLAGLPAPLRYPVSLDITGQVADGYEVQDEPWFVLVSGTGKILWWRDASTTGWPSTATLQSQVRAALAKAPSSPGSSAGLSGSPAPLAALHQQASQLLPGRLLTRVRALRGYPVVVNIWASWCQPCQKEFGVFQSASLHYGKQVAFLGADYNDQAGNARSFLAGHRVSYPSYSISPNGIPALLPGGIQATPTTVFITSKGKVSVHTGQYDSQGVLDHDIQSYALSG